MTSPAVVLRAVSRWASNRAAGSAQRGGTDPQRRRTHAAGRGTPTTPAAGPNAPSKNPRFKENPPGSDPEVGRASTIATASETIPAVFPYTRPIFARHEVQHGPRGTDPSGRASRREGGPPASREKERYTPPEILERARRAVGAIDLDPAGSEVAQASALTNNATQTAGGATVAPWGRSPGSLPTTWNPSRGTSGRSSIWTSGLPKAPRRPSGRLKPGRDDRRSKASSPHTVDGGPVWRALTAQGPPPDLTTAAAWERERPLRPTMSAEGLGGGGSPVIWDEIGSTRGPTFPGVSLRRTRSRSLVATATASNSRRRC